MVLQLPDEQNPALIHPVFRAYWAEDRDIGDDATLLDLATRARLDGPALLAGAKEDAVKALLKTATEDAVRLGLCGAPSFLVGDLLFWGQDRLMFVEKPWRVAPRGE